MSKFGGERMNEIKLHWLFLGSLINNIAVSTVWPLTTVYMHDALGKSLTEVGIILFLYSTSNVLGKIIYQGNYLTAIIAIF
ncbi:hypothetical protein AKUG0407_00160 [Apilactobacillus kunkeei]|nr:hypothetical protein AKUG0802_00160 [Apilactobacillus kunkeei]CAI2547190.1 hypothetical protein AKUG0405_00160 [Apilactobacillus kunkeei]CAI2547242.1 hypothetical protein AKUG0103_00160 [Apilactobacillus kunkeei]CAI2547249.1 hypothetical protein AKUG0804_00160 [Apilactobacillus kunkeei]CAI2547250.1 hypothetical protein AKUG0101_00160 [Apilactobacillus kunkeei]